MAIRRMTSGETRTDDNKRNDGVLVNTVIDTSNRDMSAPTDPTLASGDLVLKNYEEYLVQHARMTIWGNPYEDKQYILHLSEITGKGGARAEVRAFGQHIPLPDHQHYYHLYMIGSNFPYQFGLADIEERWIKLTDWCSESEYTVKIYNSLGKLTPLHACYLFKEYDDNLLIAIREFSNTTINLDEDDIFLHTRKANFFSYPDADKLPNDLKVTILSKVLGRDKDILDQTTLYGKAKAVIPYAQYHKNGRIVNSYQNIAQDDNVELLVDGSVLGYQYHRVGDLRTFQSVLDKKNKYLLYLYDTLGDKYQIHYRDDIEIHLIKLDSSYQTLKDLSIEKSVKALDQADILDSAYYHRNEENSLRMVTHQSYGIPVEYLHGFIQSMDSKKELNNWYLKVLVRDSGYRRRLGAERNMIYALEQLPYTDKLDAMASTESTIDNWKARVLEQSSYNFLMRAYNEELTADRVLDAYGFHLTSLVLANPNVAPTNLKVNDRESVRYFVLPVGCADRSTIYEYDENGLLLGYYHHLEGFTYSPVNPETVFIEAIVGLGSNRPSLYHNPDSIMVDKLVNFRFYRADISGDGRFLTKHQDVTDTIDLDEHPSGYKLPLDKEQNSKHWVVMGDDRFLASTVKIKADDSGYYRFMLTHGPLRTPLIIPYGKIHVWGEGVSLIEGIDYIVDFPYVTITSMEFLTKATPVDISEGINFTFRCMGFPEKSTERRKPKETGFIINETISLDYRNDIHQNKVNRMIIGGGTFNPAAFSFNHFGEATVQLPNGTPYSIDDHYIALRGFGGNKKVYRNYEEERKMEKQIDDYLSINRENRKDIPEIAPVKKHYRLYSPFLSAITKVLLKNEKNYHDFDYRDGTKLEKLVSPYKHLLNSDPAYIGYDEDYISVYPSPEYIKGDVINVIHSRIYAILEHVIKRYLKHPIDLTNWYRVSRSRAQQ